jgi:hypothetical protein
MIEFSGKGPPLTAGGIDGAASLAGVGLPELWSVVAVETSGCGYLPDRRPKILFERHVFSRLTDHRFDEDDPDISQRAAGGYGAPGAHQHDRLNAALQLDREAALMSASWGLGQIMGENFRAAGFHDVGEMVESMVASEDNQLRAMVGFMKTTNLTGTLRAHDWRGFARRYNGPNSAANNYDGLLEHFFHRFSDGPPPDVQVRMAQIYLTYTGSKPGGIDGVAGGATQSAIKAFQKSAGMEQTGRIDDDLLAALRKRAESDNH